MLLPLPRNVSKASILRSWVLHSKVSQCFIISRAHSRSCHANETCVATLIFLKRVTKAQPSPHVGEPGVQFLSCHSWLILNSASDDRDPHLTDHNTPSPSNTGKKYGHLQVQKAFPYLQHVVLIERQLPWGVQNAEILTCLTSIILWCRFLSLQYRAYLDRKKMKCVSIKKLNWGDT